jgi:hypothetical protein
MPKTKPTPTPPTAAEFRAAFEASGKTWRALAKEVECSCSTISHATRGFFPRNPHIRAALLRAVGL